MQLAFLNALTTDPHALEDEKVINTAFLARKAFETWQNNHDKSYVMPDAYKKLAEFCAQHNRTKAKAKSAAASPAPSGGNSPSSGSGTSNTVPASGDTPAAPAATSGAPPTKKVSLFEF